MVLVTDFGVGGFTCQMLPCGEKEAKAERRGYVRRADGGESAS
jgi:hypothetical protein